MGRDIGEVRAVTIVNGMVRLTVRVHSEDLPDVAVATGPRLTALSIAKGDRVWIEQPDGVDAERFAHPYEELGSTDGYKLESDAAVIHMTNGTVEIRSPAGTAASLAQLADLQAQVTWLKHQFDVTSGHTHLAAGSGPPVTVGPNAGLPTVPPPTPAGTVVAKGE